MTSNLGGVHSLISFLKHTTDRKTAAANLLSFANWSAHSWKFASIETKNPWIRWRSSSQRSAIVGDRFWNQKMARFPGFRTGWSQLTSQINLYDGSCCSSPPNNRAAKWKETVEASLLKDVHRVKRTLLKWSPCKHCVECQGLKFIRAAGRRGRSPWWSTMPQDAPRRAH